jgi:DNA-binding winged helix-turn-helix (wHTH) protein
MQKPYWVGDYLVDSPRNQITRSEQVQILQPKMFSVLNLLAQHAGEVVSHEQLMAHVWPNIYVTQNTLQRCIAELRKAFGDDSKRQAVIKTHSKQGYSLELVVKPVDMAFAQDTLLNDISFSRHSQAFKKWSLLGVLVFALFWSYLAFHAANDQTQAAFNTVQPLTASDEKEFYPDYSPDGKYMVFHRYLDVCKNHIWAKDLVTQQEFRLTKSAGIYGAHSWSADGKQLVFNLQENCSQQVEVKKICWRLQTLDFNAGLKSPQSSSLNYDCDTKSTHNPHWLNDGQILSMHRGTEANTLVKYNPIQNQLLDFEINNEGSIYYFDYSHVSQHIAVFSLSEFGEHYLTLLDQNGLQVKALKLSLPTNVSVFSRIEPKFLPDATGFILSTTNRLFKIDLNGRFNEIVSAHSLDLHTPVYHPFTHKILATKGLVDADIALVPLNDTGAGINADRDKDTATIYPSLARSNSYDVNPVFQHQSDNITFFSKRSGSTQIWQTDIAGENATQISQFPSSSKVSDFVWSDDGQRIATTVNDRLTLLFSGGHEKVVNTSFPVDRIFNWIDDQHLLIQANLSGLKQLLVFNITNGAINHTDIQDVYWAYMSKQKTLFYINQNRQLWTQQDDKTQQIQNIDGQLDGKRFFVRNNRLFGVNWQDELWQFDLTTQQFETLVTLKQSYWWVSDVRNNQALITQVMSAKQEVVELSP